MQQELTKTTISTLEIAEMMEISHNDILRKIDGRKDRKGYVQILTESQMAVSDYFIPSSYHDVSGKENKCYEVTKLGCDFLANKFTGEKGIIFTAKYVKRFHDMEKIMKDRKSINIESDNSKEKLQATILKGVAGVGNIVERTMKAQGSEPTDITKVLDSLFKQNGLVLPVEFVKVEECKQMELSMFVHIN